MRGSCSAHSHHTLTLCLFQPREVGRRFEALARGHVRAGRLRADSRVGLSQVRSEREPEISRMRGMPSGRSDDAEPGDVKEENSLKPELFRFLCRSTPYVDATSSVTYGGSHIYVTEKYY